MSVEEIYFESQSYFSMNCGVHCLNNFLGSRQFTKKQLTEICYSLSNDFINPHKHIFGGDFDMNVLMIAMQRKGYEIEFMDMRKEVSLEGEKTVEGYIINERLGRPRFIEKVASLFSERHWTCVKKIGGCYWFFNSKNGGPSMIGDEERLHQFLVAGRNKGDQICTVIRA